MSGRGTPRAGSSLEQLLPGAELHAWAAVRLARRTLGRVDRLPACVENVLDAALDEELLEVVPRGRRQQTCPCVLEQELDRLRGVLLVRADDATRPALDPPRGVQPRYDAAA